MKKILVMFLCATLALSGVLILPYGAYAAKLDLGKYSWEGEWETNWGNMVLTQSGASVVGTYTHDQGRISGTVSGNTLTGTWSEAPSYGPDHDAGDLKFVMSADGISFTGEWRYGSSGSWSGWEGARRLTPVIPAPVVDTNPNSQYKDSGIRVSELYGEVLVRRGDNEDAWELVEFGDILYEGDHIKTAEDSECILNMADMTTFQIKPEAEIIITVPSGEDSKLKLVMGNIYTNVQKMVTHGIMEVEMSQAVAGIKGTTFVCEEAGGKSTLKVLEGTVTLTSKTSGRTVSVGAGEMAVADASGNLNKSTFDIAQEAKKWDKTIIELVIGQTLMKVNGIKQEIDPGRETTPQIVNSRTLIPIRAVIEALGGTVGYEAKEQRITLKKGSDTLELWIGKADIKLNGAAKAMDTAPIILNGRTMVPVRFVAEHFGYCVAWKAAEQTVVIQ